MSAEINDSGGKDQSPARAPAAVRHKTMPIKGLGISLALPGGSDQKSPLRRSNSQSKLLSLSAGSLALANEVTEDPESAVALAELDLRSRLKINDKICSHIWEFIYLGSETVSANYELLKENGISHILNCAAVICKVYHPDKFKYRCLWLLDGKEEDISCLFYDVIDFIESARMANGHVFIHCQQGVSRSSAMTIAYLMWRNGKSYAETHSEVKKKRNVSNPNAGFVVQLMNWQKRRQTAPEEKGRFYEVVRHSTGDPTFVPKALKHPVLAAHLRSTSCFIIELPKRFYLWKGSQAEAECIAAAQRIVKQFQKYEVAPEQVVEVLEGQEPADFWVPLGGKSVGAARIPPVYVHPPLPFNADQARDFTAVRGGIDAPPSPALPTPIPATQSEPVLPSSATAAAEGERKKEKREKKDKKDKKKDKKRDKKEKKPRESDAASS